MSVEKRALRTDETGEGLALGGRDAEQLEDKGVSL